MFSSTRRGRSLAILTVLVTLLAIGLPFAPSALATHGDCLLNLEPETDSNPTGTTHTVTATVSDNATATPTSGAGPRQCDSDPAGAGVSSIEVDFEIIGPGDPNNDGNTPESPDRTCTITMTEDNNPQNDTCTISYSSNAAGDDTIKGWIDHDKNNATLTELDATEGQAEGTTAGAQTEPDATDVVAKNWFGGIAAGATLDCRDDDATDSETNAPGQAETYTCTVFDDANNNGTQDGNEAGVAGVRIDAENLNGANDPDNSAAAGTADFNDACTTSANGTCTFNLAPSENEVGTANVCFWADPDADNVFAPAGAEEDGGGCDDETATTEETQAGQRLTDVVQKTWATAAAEVLDAEPENDANNAGTQHTVTATVRDQFGALQSGVRVDFDITGRNNSGVAPECDDVLTNNQGVATCTYTDVGLAANPIPSGHEDDTIIVCVDANADDICDASDLTVAEDDADVADRVAKFWFAQVPATNTVVVDMDLPCADDDPTTDPNTVDSLHSLCAIARDAQGNPIAGKAITFTLSGPGFFVNDNGTPANTADDTNLGQSLTLAGDADGEATVTIYSTASGTTTVTATSDGKSDTGTKVWTAETAARTIDCNPETATNAPGTSHVVSCVVADRFGNPIAGTQVFFTESGPGRIDSPAAAQGANAATTNANGVVEAVVSSTANETGQQTITGRVAADATNTGAEEAAAADDECEQPANATLAAGSEAPKPTTAGVCSDDVIKNWSQAPPPQCSDGADNDNDGQIDFPADSGCVDASDNSEASADVPPQCDPANAGNISGRIIVGDDGANTLTGTEDDDIICALGGNDTVSGLGGNDLILLGAGSDVGNGGRGGDIIRGGRGGDTIRGGGGKDVLRGGGGADVVSGGGGADLVAGGGGSDTLRGGDGDDTVRGGRKNDTLSGGAGDDTLRGGPGIDTCRGGPGRDRKFSCER